MDCIPPEIWSQVLECKSEAIPKMEGVPNSALVTALDPDM